MVLILNTNTFTLCFLKFVNGILSAMIWTEKQNPPTFLLLECMSVGIGGWVETGIGGKLIGSQWKLAWGSPNASIFTPLSLFSIKMSKISPHLLLHYQQCSNPKGRFECAKKIIDCQYLPDLTTGVFRGSAFYTGQKNKRWKEINEKGWNFEKK